jgi:hypothetical protein
LTPYANARGARFTRAQEDAGRVNIDLERALSRPQSIDNIVLQPGDVLFIPPRVDFVTVRGAVGFPTSVLYERGRSPRFYISQAGGYAENADTGRTRVVLPNGSMWRPRWFFLPDPEVEAGSEIIVPVSTAEKKDTWEIIRDTTAILSSLTTALLLIWRINK